MDVTATEAKNRLGQVLELAQREPVFIEKNGRRHSVLMSSDHYEALVAAAAQPAAKARKPRNAQEFYERYKEWVDWNNDRFEKYGLWNEEFRTW
jgi:prevent-host-death family protein